jgi:CheY-like chemotaxis protein
MKGTTQSPPRSLEILLLETNPSDIGLFRSALPTGHHVTVVENGARALDLLFQRGQYANSPRPDLVVLDLNISTLNGDEVLKVTKSNRLLHSIPVVVCSESSEPESVQRAYDLGASAYLVKPTELEELESMLACFVTFWLEYVTYPRCVHADAGAMLGTSFMSEMAHD